MNKKKIDHFGDKQLKNVVIINDFDYVQGGASQIAIETANLLVEKSNLFNVYFFSGCHSDSSNLSDKIIQVCTDQGEAIKNTNKFQGSVNCVYNFKARKKLHKLLKDLDNENTIIHVHGWTKCLSSSIFDISFKLKFKVVLTLHDYFTICPNGGFFNYKKNEICNYDPLSLKCLKCNCDSRNYSFKFYRIIRQFVQNKVVRLTKRIQDVITISNFSENILKKHFNDEIKLHRVYNPILFEKVDKIKNHKKCKYFLYVGRISKEKGVDLFCEAISQLGYEGIVVGDGEQKKELEEKYSNISFVGWKNSNDVRKYIENSIALIFPSRLYETMGLTVLESLSLNRPVVVSESSAARDFVIEGKNGYLFNIDDISDLKEKIEKVKDIKYEESLDMECFSESTYIKNVIEIYNSLIS